MVFALRAYPSFLAPVTTFNSLRSFSFRPPHPRHLRPRHVHPRGRTCATLSPLAPAEPSTLYLVSTPIGNPHDLAPRARHILTTVDFIAAEDTRVTISLLKSLAIPLPSSPHALLSLHAHNVRARLPMLLGHLSAGKSVALVSDAGTPCISDPGLEVVEAAAASNIRVIPVPGPSALLAAIAASGVPAPSFHFLAFLPRSSQARNKALDTVAAQRDTAFVLFEAPHRLVATLSRLAAHRDITLRSVCLARELTKKYEELLRFDNLKLAHDYYENVVPRGEFTIVLAPAPPPSRSRKPSIHDYTNTPVDIPALVQSLLRQGFPASTVAKAVAESSDVPKKLVYAFATAIKHSISDDDINHGGSNTPGEDNQQ